MGAPAQKTDTHAVAVAPVYGPQIYEIINKRTGHVEDRVAGFQAAQQAQARLDAKVKISGQ